jgi:hypothetical protein
LVYFADAPNPLSKAILRPVFCLIIGLASTALGTRSNGLKNDGAHAIKESANNSIGKCYQETPDHAGRVPFAPIPVKLKGTMCRLNQATLPLAPWLRASGRSIPGMNINYGNISFALH